MAEERNERTYKQPPPISTTIHHHPSPSITVDLRK
jgi:hypothetical protein